MNEDTDSTLEIGMHFAETGEQLMNILSGLDYSLEKKMTHIEAKHAVYLGEDLREMQHCLKMAIRAARRINETLTDIPDTTVKEDNATSTARFRITWRGYGKTTPKIVGLDHFSDANGYDPEDIDAIRNLVTGEDWTNGGPNDSVTVTRIK